MFGKAKKDKFAFDIVVFPFDVSPTYVDIVVVFQFAFDIVVFSFAFGMVMRHVSLMDLLLKTIKAKHRSFKRHRSKIKLQQTMIHNHKNIR